jgi:hypothetical protein
MRGRRLERSRAAQQRIMRMRIALRAVAAAAIAVIFAEPALRAQTQSQTQTQVQEHVTPGWVFTPSMGFGGAWDSNVLLVNPGDTPPDDYGTPVDPSVSLDYHGRRTTLSTGYDASFLMYRTLDQLNSSAQSFRAFFEQHATKRVTVSLQESFEKAPSTDALQIAGIPFYRVGSQTNTVGGGVTAPLAKHTELHGTYSLRWVSFDFDERLVQQLQGGHEHEWTTELTQEVSPRWTLGGLYELERGIMSDSLDEFNINTGAMTVGYELSPTLKLDGMFGISRLAGGVIGETRTGPTMRAGISRHTPSLTISASYERSFIPSFGFGGTFQNEAYEANVNVPFGRNRGYANGSVAWLNSDSLQPTQPSLQSLFLASTVGYHLTRWLSLEGFLDRTRQDSQQAGGQIGRTQVGFRMVAAKPMHFR